MPPIPNYLHVSRTLIGPILTRLFPPSALGSPEALIIGSATTSLSLTTLHALQRGKRVGNLLIVGFVSIGTILGLLAGLTATDVVLRIVPWCGIAAMGITVVVCGRKTTRRIRRVETPDEKKNLYFAEV